MQFMQLISKGRTGGYFALVVLSALAGLAGCAPGQDNPGPSVGRFDASSYVAVGDSYSSGYSNGRLTRTGQSTSYPALLARQVRLAGAGAAFPQALLPEGSPAAYAGPTCSGPQTVPQFGGRAAALPQDLTVPGLRLADVETAGYGNAATPAFNPYFERLLPVANDNRTYLQAVTAAAQSATFFTYFAGMDDILPYLQSGGTCGNLPVVITRFVNSLAINTCPGLDAKAERLLDQLTANGRRGIIAQLPSVRQSFKKDDNDTKITKVPTLPLLREAETVQRQFQVGADTARLYVTNSTYGDVAAAIDTELVLASAVARIGQLTPVVVNGVTVQLPYGRNIRNPLVDADVIDADEFKKVDAVVSAHNDYLFMLAKTKYQLPSVNISDANASTLKLSDAVFGKVSKGLSIGGVQYSAVPGSGGIFSADGYTFTPRGNGLLANAFIQALNVAYSANIPFIDINALPTTAQ